jgi:hypothetical protein
MTTTKSFTYYRTWDNVNRRYLVKAALDDEWDLSPTPELCYTKGRRFNSSTGTYDPPPFKQNDLPRTWDATEGRWIFEVIAKLKGGTTTQTKETGRGTEKMSTEDEDVGAGVDIGVVRSKYF